MKISVRLEMPRSERYHNISNITREIESMSNSIKSIKSIEKKLKK